jgi:hypothetical protein
MNIDETTMRDLVSGRYAFIDGGCAEGGSIDHCERRFGKRPGLGLDWYGADLTLARSRGFAVAACNLLAQELPERCVGFVTMLDFLEHLPDRQSAIDVMRKLGAAARDFVFVRHPTFEHADDLARLGLKLTWTDWSGHTNPMTLADFRRAFATLGWSDYVILPHMRMDDSGHPAIVPLDAPVDTQQYDAALHGPKPIVRFDAPIFGKYDIFVRLGTHVGDEQWQEIASTRGWEAVWVQSP